jgi:transcriptional regulator with XRE-family HTH domain
MEDEKLRELVETELENLQLGVQIAKLRAAENLSQTKLAAKAEMSAPKISAMENEPRNLTIGTLIRVAHALGSRVEIKLVQERDEGGAAAKWRGKSQNPQPLTPKAAAPGTRAGALWCRVV